MARIELVERSATRRSGGTRTRSHDAGSWRHDPHDGRLRRHRVPGVGGAARPVDPDRRRRAGEPCSSASVGTCPSSSPSPAGPTPGVHARGQVTSFTTTTSAGAGAARDGVNAVARAPSSSSGRPQTRPASSTRGSRQPRESIVYGSTTGDVADPFTARFVWHRPGGCTCPRCVAAAGPARRRARLRLVLPRPGTRTIDGPASSTRRRATGGRSAHVRVPCGRVPASDGSLTRRNAGDGGDGSSRTGCGRSDPRRGAGSCGGATDRAAARSHPRARHLRPARP